MIYLRVITFCTPSAMHHVPDGGTCFGSCLTHPHPQSRLDIPTKLPQLQHTTLQTPSQPRTHPHGCTITACSAIPCAHPHCQLHNALHPPSQPRTHPHGCTLTACSAIPCTHPHRQLHNALHPPSQPRIHPHGCTLTACSVIPCTHPHNPQCITFVPSFVPSAAGPSSLAGLQPVRKQTSAPARSQPQQHAWT